MRILLLTPKLNGSDGISLVSRTALAALQQAANGCAMEVRSLAAETFSPEQMAGGSVCRSAGNSKARYIGWGLPTPAGGRGFELTLAMHVHLAPLAIIPHRRSSGRLAIFLHGIEAWNRLTWLEDLAVRRASHLLANSRYTVQRFKQINPQHREREVRICPLGVPALHAPGEYGDGRYGLIVGRMVRQSQYKGHDQLLDLWGQVQTEAPGFRLLVAGDGEDRPRLEAKARRLGLESRVEFLGLVDEPKLLELYQNCSFFIMPSSCEGFGLVFLEAMRARKACIAGLGAAAEVIEDGVSGFLVNPQAREQLQGAILQLIRDPERARRMGAAGYERFMSRFTAECFGRRLRDALEMKVTPEVPQCVG